MLGAPVGVNVQAVSALAVQIAQEHETMFKRLQDERMPAQESLYLLRLCGVPKWNYIVRCVRPDCMIEANRVFESFQLDTFRRKARIDALEVTERLKQEWSLPVVDHGGWGLRRPQDVSQFAWFSAQAASASLLQSVLTHFSLIPQAAAAANDEMDGKHVAEVDGKDEKDESAPLVHASAKTARFVATEKALAHIKQRCGKKVQEKKIVPTTAADCLPFFIAKAEREANPPGEDEDNQDDEDEKKNKKELKRKLQSVLTKSAEARMFKKLKGARDARDKRMAAFLTARCLPHAHHWKLVVGSTGALRLSSSEMAVNIRVESGLPALPVEQMGDKCGLCKNVN